MLAIPGPREKLGAPGAEVGSQLAGTSGAPSPGGWWVGLGLINLPTPLPPHSKHLARLPPSSAPKLQLPPLPPSSLLAPLSTSALTACWQPVLLPRKQGSRPATARLGPSLIHLQPRLLKAPQSTH